MQTIKRDIYVTKNVLQAPIEVTEGTNSIAIEFDVRDYDIPASAAAVAYSLSTSSMEEPNKALADVSENKITIIPSETFFLPGQNVMQVRIIDGNSKLISFNIIVKCTGKMRFGDEKEEQQSTLVEQMLAKLGEYQKKSASPYNFKGSCLSSALPASGNTINDTYYCTDLKYRKTWNGSAWEQSSLNEADYEDELTKTNGEVSSLKEDLDNQLSINFNKFDASYSYGYWRPTDGTEATNNNTNIHSELIQCTDKFIITNNGDLNEATDILIFINVYDKNKNFIKTLNSNGYKGTENHFILISENMNDYYIGITLKFANDRLITETHIKWFKEIIKTFNSKDILYIPQEISNFKQIEAFYTRNKINNNTFVSDNFDFGSFSTKTPLNISRNGKSYGTDFDIRSHKYSLLNGKTYYVAPNGLDMNNGLTPYEPFKTIDKALSMNDVITIILASGNYWLSDNFSANLTIEKNVNIICNDEARIILCTPFSYQSTNKQGVYTFAHNDIKPRFYIDSYSLKFLTDATNIDSMKDFEKITGRTNSIIKLPYAPTKDNLYLTSTGIEGWTFTKGCYIEGLTFIGGYRGACNTKLTDSDFMYFNGCKFLYSRNNGLAAVGGNYYMYRCEASNNYLDGFNYHSNNNNSPNVSEIECAGFHNGLQNIDDNLYSNNCSSLNYSRNNSISS